MCHKIEASFIIMHLLKTKRFCTIGELVKKKYMIEKNIPSVFIDVSKSSVLNSVECYPEIFEFSDNQITKKKNSSRFFKKNVIEYFNFDLEDSIRRDVTKILDDGTI